MKKFFTEKKKNYLMSLLFTIVIMLIYNNSFYWPEEGFETRKMIERIIVVATIIIIPLLFVLINKLNQLLTRIRHWFLTSFFKLKKNVKSVIFYVVSYILATGAAYGIEVIMKNVKDRHFNEYQFYLIAAVLYIILSVIFLRKIAGKRPEILFFVIIMIAGTVYIRTSPAIVGISWDDEIHYNRTLNLANGLNGIMYESDAKIINEYADNITQHLYYDSESQKEYYKELDRIYRDKQVYACDYDDYDVWSIAYIPYAVGLRVARGLSLSYMHVFMMGKFFNLLTYGLLFYFSIKRVRYGKILISAIGLIPEIIFMACSYSYDPWVIAFTIFGFSYFISILQDHEKTMTLKDAVIMAGAIVIGCLPKAVYFPLLFPMMFMPLKKFKSKKQHRIYIGIIIVAGLILVSSFLLPMVVSGPGSGDSRGGDDVNSAEQIQYILNNPLDYGNTLYEFLKQYLSISNGSGYLQCFAYLGMGSYYEITIITLFVVAFLDRGEERIKQRLIKITNYIALFGIVLIVPTVLYISFTAVGNNWIEGCQPRYLLPAIFPFFYFLGPDGLKSQRNKAAFAAIPMLIIIATFLYNINTLCVGLY